MTDFHDLPFFPTRRSSDLGQRREQLAGVQPFVAPLVGVGVKERGAVHLARRAVPVEREGQRSPAGTWAQLRSEEHTSELQSRGHLVCRLLLEKKKYSEKDM